jgi:peptidoglycan/xylan/chitin deacetylase (PgdA/CDA1 family)
VSGTERRPAAAVSVTFDNLGEVTALERGEWPEGEPLGRHFSVTRALPRLLDLLAETGLRATFFVEGLNAELYPDTLRAMAAAGHEVAYHGWCHEPWAELEPAAERELLERGVRRLGELGLRPSGFRPPGGDLTPASPALLRELGFTYCSPAVGTRAEGLAVLPFRWELLDAFHYLPRFAGLRAEATGAPDPMAPARLRATVLGALEAAARDGAFLALLFHPFLSEPEERFAVIRDALERVRALVDEGAVWCAPCREVAAARA